MKRMNVVYEWLIQSRRQLTILALVNIIDKSVAIFMVAAQLKMIVYRLSSCLSMASFVSLLCFT